MAGEVTREADHHGAGSRLPVPRPVSPSTPHDGAWSGDVLAAHAPARVSSLGGVDREPLRARYLVRDGGAGNAPPPRPPGEQPCGTSWATRACTVSRTAWQSSAQPRAPGTVGRPAGTGAATRWRTTTTQGSPPGSSAPTAAASPAETSTPCPTCSAWPPSSTPPPNTPSTDCARSGTRGATSPAGSAPPGRQPTSAGAV